MVLEHVRFAAVADYGVQAVAPLLELRLKYCGFFRIDHLQIGISVFSVNVSVQRAVGLGVVDRKRIVAVAGRRVEPVKRPITGSCRRGYRG